MGVKRPVDNLGRPGYSIEFLLDVLVGQVQERGLKVKQENLKVTSDDQEGRKSNIGYVIGWGVVILALTVLVFWKAAR